MAENNKHNILYFEGQSMRDLHSNMDEWQKENEKRFLSMSINKDGDNYCCIALTNPSEVVIMGTTTMFDRVKPITVNSHGHLYVTK
tara:strand:+ start:324 stop:581 length:258 start_codon:yes stop_codon:yes gene_type:complete